MPCQERAFQSHYSAIFNLKKVLKLYVCVVIESKLKKFNQQYHGQGPIQYLLNIYVNEPRRQWKEVLGSYILITSQNVHCIYMLRTSKSI